MVLEMLKKHKNSHNHAVR